MGFLGCHFVRTILVQEPFYLVPARHVEHHRPAKSILWVISPEGRLVMAAVQKRDIPTRGTSKSSFKFLAGPGSTSLPAATGQFSFCQWCYQITYIIGEWFQVIRYSGEYPTSTFPRAHRLPENLRSIWWIMRDRAEWLSGWYCECHASRRRGRTRQESGSRMGTREGEASILLPL
jgi:hypothetical protein